MGIIGKESGGDFPLIEERKARVKRLWDEIAKILDTNYSIEMMEAKTTMIKALEDRIEYIESYGLRG